MPLMNIFEPIFLLLAIIAIGSLLTAVIFGEGGWFQKPPIVWLN